MNLHRYLESGEKRRMCSGDRIWTAGIVVDTHVKRVANRLDLTHSSNPDQIERDLQSMYPHTQWTDVSQRLLLHGRYVCLARKPRCSVCPIYNVLRVGRKTPEMIKSMTGFGRRQGTWSEGLSPLKCDR